MKEPTRGDILALLKSPGCPVIEVRRTDERVVPVCAFIRFARDQEFATGPVEALANDVVASMGGERQDVVDVFQSAKNLVRRAAGQLPEDRLSVWVLPPH